MTKKSDGSSAMMYVLFAIILVLFLYIKNKENIKKNEFISKSVPNYPLKIL